MSAELEDFEAARQLDLYREYQAIAGTFNFAVDCERRFYLANDVDVQARPVGNDIYFELTLTDAWVWDDYRPNRFLKSVRIITYKDVNVEALQKPEIDLP